MVLLEMKVRVPLKGKPEFLLSYHAVHCRTCQLYWKELTKEVNVSQAGVMPSFGVFSKKDVKHRDYLPFSELANSHNLAPGVLG